jgi:hypothetical protein
VKYVSLYTKFVSYNRWDTAQTHYLLVLSMRCHDHDIEAARGILIRGYEVHSDYWCEHLDEYVGLLVSDTDPPDMVMDSEDLFHRINQQEEE